MRLPRMVRTRPRPAVSGHGDPSIRFSGQGIDPSKTTMILELLKSLDGNPVFSGGLTLMVIGSAAALFAQIAVAALVVCRAPAVDRAGDLEPRPGVSLGPDLVGLAPVRAAGPRSESDHNLGQRRTGPDDRDQPVLELALGSGLAGPVRALACAWDPPDDVPRPDLDPEPAAPRPSKRWLGDRA